MPLISKKDPTAIRFRHFAFPIFILFILISLLIINTGLGSAQIIEPEALYKRGLARFQQGKYVSARLDFSEIITHHPTSSRVTPAFVMLAKTFFELGDYRSAESTALTLRSSHPDSRYVDWTDYIIAACRFRQDNVDEALSLLASLAAYGIGHLVSTRR